MRYKVRKYEAHEVIDQETDEIMLRSENRDDVEQHADMLNEQATVRAENEARLARGEDLSVAAVEVEDSVGANDAV